MKHVWTWTGKYFGYIDGNALWSYKGQHVGQIINNEIYNPEGRYIGEVMDNDRLITKKSKKNTQVSSFTPSVNRVSFVKCANSVGNVMHVGYQDFNEDE